MANKTNTDRAATPRDRVHEERWTIITSTTADESPCHLESENTSLADPVVTDTKNVDHLQTVDMPGEPSAPDSSDPSNPSSFYSEDSRASDESSTKSPRKDDQLDLCEVGSHFEQRPGPRQRPPVPLDSVYESRSLRNSEIASARRHRSDDSDRSLSDYGK